MERQAAMNLPLSALWHAGSLPFCISGPLNLRTPLVYGAFFQGLVVNLGANATLNIESSHISLKYRDIKQEGSREGGISGWES